MPWISFARHFSAIAAPLVGGLFLAVSACQPCQASSDHRADGTSPSISSSSVEGLIPVGSQPKGGLSGKIVYVHGGHGYTANNPGDGTWSFQRPALYEMVEDLGNQDQMTFLVDYLFRAGATIVPLRPVGHQINEIILDNDRPEVSFHGDWGTGSGPVYFGKRGTIPYRFAKTSIDETAYARYQANIPEAGYYPVYTWVAHGDDRACDQLYRIQHAGGASEVTVNHRRVGNGLVYLGTYFFSPQSDAWVDISNRSESPNSIVIADMIRFGNGMGDIDRGAGVSGRPREDEAGLYWVQWHVDRAEGIPNSAYRVTSRDRNATVSLAPRYSEFMNREQDGELSDRVFVSFHSNASGGRGALALHNTTHRGDTPNQVLLAKSLAQEINNDLVAQNGLFEHNWHNRGTNVLYENPNFNYGELNNNVVNDEFDATIVEVAFHDNQLDAELMRDPRVRDAVARATYQGLVKYFRAVDGNRTPSEQLPGPVSNVRAVSYDEGSVTISWQAPRANSYLGDRAEAYRIYTSTNGHAYDGGRYVEGGQTEEWTVTDLNPALLYFFQVVAVNQGGESPASQIVAALPNARAKELRIINPLNRLDRALNARVTVGSEGNTVERVRLRAPPPRELAIEDANPTAAD